MTSCMWTSAGLARCDAVTIISAGYCGPDLRSRARASVTTSRSRTRADYFQSAICIEALDWARGRSSMISPQRQWRYRICPARKCFRVGPRTLEAAGPIRIIGPGTGLGVSALIPEGQKWVMVAGEHVTSSGQQALRPKPRASTKSRATRPTASDAQQGPAEAPGDGPGRSRLAQARARGKSAGRHAAGHAACAWRLVLVHCRSLASRALKASIRGDR
jgi:hypothetical protein